MTAPINTSFYADPQGLAELRSSARANDPAALKQAAQQFESLFTKMLLKNMREANKSFGDSLFSSEQTEFYEGMFDDQLAVQLSQGKGLGLADMLVRQLSGVGATQAEGSGQTAKSDTAASVLPTPQATGAEPIASSREDFIRQMLPHAEKAAREIGVDPHALLAQAALETGWGKSVPSTATGDSSFNLFGIKAGSQWSGATANVPTLEFEDGVAVKKVERFRSYESAAASFEDYAKLIGNSARYESARGSGSDIASFATALQQGGYATDPEYARKIVAVAEQLRSLAKADAIKSTADAPIASYAGVRS
jgi:flagellar protein FlgJ